VRHGPVLKGARDPLAVAVLVEEVEGVVDSVAGEADGADTKPTGALQIEFFIAAT